MGKRSIAAQCVLWIGILGSLKISLVSGAITLQPIPGSEATIDPGSKNLHIREEKTNDAGKTSMLLAKLISTLASPEFKINSIFPRDVKLTLGGDDGDVLTLNQPLDHEDVAYCSDVANEDSCYVTLRIQDTNETSSAQNVLIYIEDFNDNPPEFKPTTCEPVEENVEDVELCTFEATDRDRWIDKDSLKFSIKETMEIFELPQQDSNTAKLRIKAGQHCDFETAFIHSLTIVVADSEPDKHPAEVGIFIRVNDVSDMPPIWSRLDREYAVDENKKIGDQIAQFEAVDGDREINSPITYSISITNGTNEDGLPYFSLNPNGAFTVTADLDTAKMMKHRGSISFTAEVTATEVDLPGDSSKSNISITIVDQNTHGIEFDGDSEFIVDFAEDDSTKTLPLTVTVVDYDTDSRYNDFTAEIQRPATCPNQGGCPWFEGTIAINEEKGTEIGYRKNIYTLSIPDLGRIDYDDDTIPEWRQAVVFTILFKSTDTDKGDEATATVTLNVLNSNDNTPAWIYNNDTAKNFNFLIVENTESGCVGVLKATDGDNGVKFGQDSLRYYWDEQSAGQTNYLEINDITGNITIINGADFDFEKVKTETFVVKVMDNEGQPGGNTATARLKIDIGDINDEPPSIRIVPSTASVSEAGTVGSNVSGIVITVADADADADKVCSLVPPANPPPGSENWFKVEEDCSAIKVNETIDRELNIKDGFDAIDQVEISVMVEDRNGTDDYKRSDTTTIIIKIEDINDNPPKLDDTYSYTDISIQETKDDYESEPRLRILTFVAIDVDKNPKYCFKIDSKAKALVDLNGQECIVGGDVSPSGRLVISRKNGTKIDRDEVGSPYLETKTDGNNKDARYLQFNVTVCNDVTCNEKTSTGPEVIWVRVDDRNDNTPVFNLSLPKSFDIDEDWNEGDPALDCKKPEQINMNFTATDMDECSDGGTKYGCVGYRLNVQNQAVQPFVVNNVTGFLKTVACTIDYETVPSYTVVITAYDDDANDFGSLKADFNLTINVKDINDNKPIFKTNPDTVSKGIYAQIDEESAPEEKVGGTITITDADSGDNARLNATIVKIECSRNGGPCPADDVDDVSPFELVAQSQTDVHTLQVDVLTTSDFNFTDAYGIYCLTINVADAGKPPLETPQVYCIEVVDINNNPPIWEEWDEDVKDERFLVSERLSISGEPLYKHNKEDLLPAFLATDADDPQSVRNNSVLAYKITTNPELFAEFMYHNVTDGQLYWTKPYDLQVPNHKSTIDMKIVVSDLGEPSMSSEEVEFTLRVIPKSKSDPYFETLTQTLSIKENLIGDVGEFYTGEDDDITGKDEEGDEKIFYYIMEIGGVANDEFQIEDPLTGLLKTIVPLDREAKGSYDIIIYASNFPAPPPSLPRDPEASDNHYLRVTVVVEDVNDCAPLFNRQSLSAGVSIETNFDDEILSNDTIIAMDADADSNYTKTGYSISKMTPSDLSLKDVPEPQFNLKKVEDGGAQLTINFKPQTAMKGYFTFNITAYDEEDRSLNNTIEGKIYIVTTNDFKPFPFQNDHRFVESKRSQLERIFSAALKYECNIDKIDQTEGGSTGVGEQNRTTVQTHFVDVNRTAPVVSKEEIEKKEFDDPKMLRTLVDNLALEGLTLISFSDKAQEESTTDIQKIIMYVLVAGCGVLLAVLIILAAVFLFKYRGKSREVRALKAGTSADPQTLDLEQTGVNPVLPNTNAYALKGSNPMWTEEADEKRMPAFDSQSIASGGSSLIGVEQQDDFKDHDDDANENPAFEDEFNSSADEGDAYGMGSIRNPAYNPDYSEIGVENNYDYPTNGSSGPGPGGIDPLASVSRRNPLMEMGLQ